jgi:hypothetical protein
MTHATRAQREALNTRKRANMIGSDIAIAIAIEFLVIGFLMITLVTL